jgi:hypothetical protein
VVDSDEKPLTLPLTLPLPFVVVAVAEVDRGVDGGATTSVTLPTLMRAPVTVGDADCLCVENSKTNNRE